jgi:Phosphotransferase enzyme family
LRGRPLEVPLAERRALLLIEYNSKVSSDPVSGVERAVFGALSDDEVTAWLAEHVRARLAVEVACVSFRSGRVSAVYGLRLASGVAVVVKVLRTPVDLNRLRIGTACQRRLAEAGFPCPRPLDGPATTDGRTAIVETLLERGGSGDAHDASTRRAIARSLAAHVDMLRGVDADALVPGAPGWAVYQHGPWPVPHDPVFDFSSSPVQYGWLDELARDAARTLGPPDQDAVVGHGDWVCQNLRFAGGEVVAAYDWDSLVGRPEPVLAGLSAGAHTEGSSSGSTAPTPDEVASFLADYDQARARRFTPTEQADAAAAATWVLAYNARCELSAQRASHEPSPGSPLSMLSRHGATYLRLRW